MILNFSPFISIILSLLLINGFFNLSFKTVYLTGKVFGKEDKFFLKVLNFFLITNLLSIITFIYSLYFNLNLVLIKGLSFLIIIFGLYKPTYLKSIIEIFNSKQTKIFLIFSILFFYFLLSSSPITDPDSLDYHVTIPLYQINFLSNPIDQYWLTSQLSGAGESLFLYALSIGGLNFSQNLQFFSLLFLILFILNFKNKKIKFSNEKKYHVSLCILIMPVFLFLVSTSKPQVFSLVTNFLALILSIMYLPRLKKNHALICYSIIVTMLCCSTQFKFSFFLSSGIIFFLAFIEMIKKKHIIISLFISIFIASIIILPREIYEFLTLNSNFVYNFFNPVTDVFSADNYNVSLKHGTGNSPLFPIWIFFPYPNLGDITYSLGITSLYFLLNINLRNKLNRKVFIISFIFIFIALLFAQPVGRFFIEPLLWLLFFSIFYFELKNNFITKYLNKILVIYSVIFLIFLSYYSLNLFKGNLNQNMYEKVLSKNADGYLLYKWANEVLPDNSVIISTHRSHAFFKHKVISYEFRLYPTSHTSDGFKYYLGHIINENPKYILYSSSEYNDKKDILKNCRGKLLKFKKNVGHTSGRNPFFKKDYYDGYIFYLDKNKLKNCIL